MGKNRHKIATQQDRFSIFAETIMKHETFHHSFYNNSNAVACISVLSYCKEFRKIRL